MVIAYNALAEEMRALAKRAKDPKSSEQFLKLAKAYEDLARGQGGESPPRSRSEADVNDPP